MAPVVIAEEVHAALAGHRPIVALESTIISHGFPRPRNAEVAALFEKKLRDQGVVPATIAVIDGVATVGLTGAELERIATDTSVIKVSARDLPVAMAQGMTGGTTVAAAAVLAARAGIRVFSTGGLGGVHRGGSETYDESGDLTTLATTPITVVAAGVKSILDIPATLERLETYNVTVVGYRTDRFPGFWLTDSGCPLDLRVDSPQEVAAVMAAADTLGQRSAVLVANPLPPDKQLDPQLHDRALASSLAEAEAAGVTGKDVSPFLLDAMRKATEGRSLEVNIDIAVNNITVGGHIASAWAQHQRAT
jgi:pseudouridine-5'-phosphate glycosidase